MHSTHFSGHTVQGVAGFPSPGKDGSENGELSIILIGHFLKVKAILLSIAFS